MQSRFKPVAIPGSAHEPIHGEASYALGHSNPISVTVMFEASATKAQYEEMSVFAAAHYLAVTNTDERKRTMTLLGAPDDMAQAFQVHLSHVINPRTGRQIRQQTGAVHVPESLAPHVLAVLGLDKRPIAHPWLRIVRSAAHPNAAVKPFTVKQVMDLYQFPAGLTGAGVTAAIIELAGGYTDADLNQYFTTAGVTRPTIIAKSVDGATNSPGDDADAEVLLDIEVLGNVAPGCTIAVYFAPNTDQGFVNAILQVAVDATAAGKIDKPQIFSISWGGAEDTWTPMALGAMNAALKMASQNGVSTFVAAGDNGSSDADPSGAHVDHPASSEYVTACGGTRLIADGATITSETVWNGGSEDGATGGGVSNVFGLPPYQQGHNVPLSPTKFLGRGVPDVAANADPESGYLVVVNGEQQAIGGTSAVAPLLAGLTALLIEKNGGKSFGNLNSHFYRITESVFRDVTSGSNGAYKAAKNWDCASGFGSINGTALLNTLLPRAAKASTPATPSATTPSPLVPSATVATQPAPTGAPTLKNALKETDQA